MKRIDYSVKAKKDLKRYRHKLRELKELSVCWKYWVMGKSFLQLIIPICCMENTKGVWNVMSKVISCSFG